MTKKETNFNGTLSEAVSVATSVAYTRQEIQKLKTELVSLLEKKTAEVIVEQVPGPVGPRGALGATGAQGPKGDKGDKGDVGERGEKGDVGQQGEIGPEGLPGIKGDKGDIGPQGIQGITGNRGEKGDKGEDGKNGLDGRDGEAGSIGPAGPTGEKGLQGERGEKGDKGDRGDSGKDGQQGIQGSVGPRGEIGPQGIQGVPGKDGKDADVKAIEKSINQFKEGLQKDVSQYKAKVNTIISSGIGGGSGGSGEVNLRYLDDIDRNSIQDGFVLSFDEASQKFVFVEQSGGGGGTIDVFARARANTAWNTANSAYLQANSAYNQANLSFTQANSAYNQANNANSLAQAVYNYANTLTFSGDGTDNLARSIANSAFSTANTKSYTFSQNTAPVTANTNDFWANTDSAIVYYNFSNTATPLWVEFGPTGTSSGGTSNTDLTGYAVNTTVNLVWSTANSAYTQANTATTNAETANTKAQAAYDYANTIVVPSLSGYAVNTTVNTIWSTANSAYTQANTATTLAQAAYDYANTIVVPSLSGYAVNTIVDIVWSNSNSAFSTANASYNQANTATTNASNADVKAQAAYDYANTIVVPSLSGYATNTTVNLVWSTANSAYAQANSANSLAQAAYDYANTLSGNVGTLQQVTTAGNTTTVGMTTTTLAFNLTSANTVTTGQMAWNAADLTVDVGMSNGVTLQLGQEQYIKIKAGEAISDGEAVMFGGASGEHIIGLRNNMSATGYIPEWFIGIATQNFALNEFGYVTVFGKVNGLNTLAYTVGDILFANPAVVGGLTNVEPDAPNYNIVVAAVTKRAGGDGHLMVRPTFRSSLSNLNDVQITSVANNNLLKYNSANTRWENVSASSIIEPAYAQANTATTLAQAAYNQANTGGSTSQLINGSSIVSLSNNDILTVPGPISGLGNSKLDFTTYGSNTAYLTTTSDDSTALFMSLQAAELYAHTTVQIRTNTAGISQNWTFGADGTLTFPDNTTQTTAFTGTAIDSLARTTANSAITTSGGTITYQPVSTTGYGLAISSANTQGGTGYADFLKVTNSSTGATNPNKSFRLDSAGNFQIINSAYTANLFELSDSGNLNLPSGTLRVGGKQTVNGPAFSVYRNSTATIPTDVLTLMAWTTEEYDTAGCMTSTRFTPNVEGYYSLVGSVRIDGDIGTGERMISIKKNGNEYRRGMNAKGTASVGTEWFQMEVSCQVYANGTTDYFELFVQHGAGTNRTTTAGQPFTAFQGCMIRGA